MAETMKPEPIAATEMPMTDVRSISPDLAAEAPLTAWNQMGNFAGLC